MKWCDCEGARPEHTTRHDATIPCEGFCRHYARLAVKRRPVQQRMARFSGRWPQLKTVPHLQYSRAAQVQ